MQWHPEADETSRLIAALVEDAAQRVAERRTAPFTGPRRPILARDRRGRATPNGYEGQPPEVDPPEPDEEHDPDEEMPRLQVTRRSLVLGVVFVVSALAFLYFVLPQLADLRTRGERIGEGNPWWLAAAFVFTLASFGGYVVLFQGVFVRAGSRIDLRASYQITMAGAGRDARCSPPAARAASR